MRQNIVINKHYARIFDKMEKKNECYLFVECSSALTMFNLNKTSAEFLIDAYFNTLA